MKLYLRRPADGKYAYVDMSDVHPRVGFTPARALAYTLLTREEAQRFADFLLRGDQVEIVEAPLPRLPPE